MRPFSHAFMALTCISDELGKEEHPQEPPHGSSHKLSIAPSAHRLLSAILLTVLTTHLSSVLHIRVYGKVPLGYLIVTTRTCPNQSHLQPVPTMCNCQPESHSSQLLRLEALLFKHRKTNKMSSQPTNLFFFFTETQSYTEFQICITLDLPASSSTMPSMWQPKQVHSEKLLPSYI